MARRRYTEDFRSKCLSLVDEQMKVASSREDAIVTVAASLRIPVTTLRNWVRAERGAARTDQLPADAVLAIRSLQQQVLLLQRAAGVLGHGSD
ncbi:hypothetical protein [Rhodococcus koreensis]|uniref:hypothetical protein n=1 Tax=Rhodococcus koreensis TaxID=99653 RepID=UPI0019803119|nr:hypothetical protein [Rhodococcus koreensis]QSE87011.1 hypothetical protein JWS14_49450 [Rhodococcus koreensis]